MYAAAPEGLEDVVVDVEGAQELAGQRLLQVHDRVVQRVRVRPEHKDGSREPHKIRNAQTHLPIYSFFV